MYLSADHLMPVAIGSILTNRHPGRPNSSPGYIGIAQSPEFSLPGGRYDNGISISFLTPDPQLQIRYTVDGSRPDEQSPLYQVPVLSDTSMVIRARSFKEGYISSEVRTQSYFINETTSLPIVSIATNPKNLWDDEIGIYVEGTNGVSGYCVLRAKKLESALGAKNQS